MKRIVFLVTGVLSLVVVAAVAYVYAVNRPLPATAADTAILERTLELLADESHWSRQDDRTCGPGKPGLSLYCALRQASLEVTGEFRHRAAALQEVRYAIDRHKPDADYAHRLMDYNNDPGVTLSEVHAVLREALARLAASGS